VTLHLRPPTKSVLAMAATLALTATAAVAAGCAGAGSPTGEPSADPRAGASGSRASKNGRIVFQRLDPDTGKIRLYTVRPNGSGLRAITLPGASEDNDSQAAWSPDGSRIALRRFFDPGEPGERSDVLVVRPDGTGLRNLTQGSCSGDCLSSDDPAWSPDGRRIAFERAIGPLPTDGPPPIAGIFVMNADGSGVRQVTQLEPGSGTEDHAPAWSPDGHRIAFMRANNTARPENASAIYTVEADGSNERLLRRMPPEWPGAGAPDWSPDGSRILFQTYCYFGNCGSRALASGRMRVRGAGRRPFAGSHGRADRLLLERAGRGGGCPVESCFRVDRRSGSGIGPKDRPSELGLPRIGVVCVK
jgi:Tol biopolymer transport system component